MKEWCRDPELNWGRKAFQAFALPTELSRHDDIFQILMLTSTHFIQQPKNCQYIRLDRKEFNQNIQH